MVHDGWHAKHLGFMSTPPELISRTLWYNNTIVLLVIPYWCLPVKLQHTRMQVRSGKLLHLGVWSHDMWVPLSVPKASGINSRWNWLEVHYYLKNIHTDLQFVFYPSGALVNGAWQAMASFFGINIWHSIFLVSSCREYSYHGIHICMSHP